MSDNFLAKLDEHVARSVTQSLERENQFQVISSITDAITAGLCSFEQLVRSSSSHSSHPG